ncbi:MAG TPA: GntR family transcriptional regulator [Woeseiaceae bacterium]|jgi:GntR family transcriptional regulator|nr:GntR family transcriptional regulator [Woeseiaceae bacterium]
MRRNRRIKQSLYLDLASELRDRIVSKKWKPGDLLPSETELCRDFGVSRGTVVKALDVLNREGLAQRRQGVGTFVSRPALHRMPGFILGFSETVRQQGRTPTHRLVDQAELTRTEALQYGCDEPALMLNRIRLVDGVPWAIHKAVIPLSLAEKVPALYGAESEAEQPGFSLYTVLEDAGHTIDHADEAVNTRLATAEEAQLLEIDMPAAVMLVHRKSFDTRGRLVELIEAVYLGECYTYETQLVRAHGASGVSADNPPETSGASQNA